MMSRRVSGPGRPGASGPGPARAASRVGDRGFDGFDGLGGFWNGQGVFDGGFIHIYICTCMVKTLMVKVR